MKRPDIAWAAWLTAVLASFAALEVPALRRRDPGKPSGTLTYWMRGVLGTRPGEKRRRRWVLGTGFAAFLAYLGGHMLAGWWNS